MNAYKLMNTIHSSAINTFCTPSMHLFNCGSVYISLTGAKFEGRDGILAQREDELLYPSRGGSAGPASSRAELCNVSKRCIGN
jgi:hypothetical protein